MPRRKEKYLQKRQKDKDGLFTLNSPTTYERDSVSKLYGRINPEACAVNFARNLQALRQGTVVMIGFAFEHQPTLKLSKAVN